MDNIREEFSFGIDLGIGSCGWAVIERTEESGRIVDMGSWCFDVPETNKERKPTNQIRQENRLLRRVIRRRRQRMNEIRKLFAQYGLIPTNDRDGLKILGLDPWKLRARALDNLLKGEELAVALGAIAKRRGFKSVAKRAKSSNASDEGKMLSALSKTRELLARYRTVGEMFACDEKFQERRRNREGRYDRTSAREDLEYETKRIFDAQMRLGNPLVSDDLRERYEKIAFFQRPLQDSENLLGYCRFEKEEKRASKFSPTFEKFRLLTRLVNLRVRESGVERALTVDELRRAVENLGEEAKISVKEIHKKMGLGEDVVFTTIPTDRENNDIAVRTGESMTGTKILREALGKDLWSYTSDEQRDAITHCLTFFETNSKIMEKLDLLNLSDEIMAALNQSLESGMFASFKGAADLSDKAMRKLIPHLEQGWRYDEACLREGYNYTASLFDNRAQVISKKQFNQLAEDVTAAMNNPIAKKALLESLKQIRTLILHYGLPGSICIELARDIGHSLDKRREIEDGIKEATKEREREREEVRELLGLSEVDATTLLRYRLWKEQGGRCLYSDRAIDPRLLKSGDEVQIDHILPWSRFGDDSFNNKTLCFAEANQQKRNQTPYEWMGGDEKLWQRFTCQVEALGIKDKKKSKSLADSQNKEGETSGIKGMKKRNYLLKDAKEREDGFRSRNLNDTRYAARILAEAVRFFYPENERAGKGEVRRVFTRPGKLTSILRKAWGVESLKKDEQGQRLPDDRHHALDAVVVAAVGEGEINRLTRDYQQWEKDGMARPLRGVMPPWPNFRNEVAAILEKIDGQTRAVARSERRRARGEGHAATIRQLKERDGKQVVFERKAVTALKNGDLDNIKDPECNQHIIKAIKDWMMRGSPKGDLPCTPTGIEITKVTLKTNKEKAVTALKNGDLDNIKDPERNQHIIKAIKDWMTRGSPKGDLPRTPTGIEITKVTLETNKEKAVTALKNGDLENIKDPERNQHIIKAIKDWMTHGSQKDDLPRTPTGIEITKVTLKTNKKPDVFVRGGVAERGNIVRVDVFNKVDKKGKNEWYLVPIYRHQVMDRKKWPMPPNRAIVGGRDEAVWPVMDENYHFCLSIYPRSYVEVIKGGGEIKSGYFAGVDRATGSINLLKHNDESDRKWGRGIGVKTLLRITKYNVDRLGHLYEVKSEPRLWHGEICTYPTRPG